MSENKPESNLPTTSSAEPPKDQLVTTQHSLGINGETLTYTVTCGTLVLKEEAEKRGEAAGEFEGEKARATIFFTAYTRDGVVDRSRRPLTFCFNGGPGSSSVWLHLGVLGPRRVWLDEQGNPPPPPYHLVENEYSLLDVTDLVFIDPVSTGFSRAVPGEKASQFHGFKKDIESVGDFIRLYTSRNQRWNSPKFLIGESYGTTRAAGLSWYLLDRHALYLNGLMLISTALNFQTLEFEAGNDLPYILILPSYTATAWYHHCLPDDLQANLQAALAEAEAFALGEYNVALMKGAALPAAERQAVVAKLARLTGLSPDYIERVDLRVELLRFDKELLRQQGLMIGRLDSRYKGYDRDNAGERPEFDPSYSNVLGPYAATFNQYVRSELNFESDLPYEIINPRVWPWSYAEHENKYLNVAETLRKAITSNPYLKVFIACGYYDLATPYLASDYVFNHLGLPPALQDNLFTAYYESGHMMYVHRPSLAKLKDDLAGFIRTAGG